MPKENNIWSKAFNQSSLENEKWLEPSPMVFEKVKAEIYKKKKKRRFLIFFVFLFGLAGCTALAIQVFSSKHVSSEQQIAQNFNAIDEASLVSTIEASLGRANEPSNTMAKESNTDIKKQTNLEIQTESDIKTATTISDVNTSTTISNRKQANSASQTTIPSEINNIYKSPAEGNELVSQTSNLLKIQSAFSKPSLQDDNEKDIDNSEIDLKQIESKNINSTLTQSQNLNEDHFIVQNQRPNLNKLTFNILYPELLEYRNIILNLKIDSSIYKKKSLRNEITIGAGYSNWIFNLNNSYQTSLDPADFSHQAGHGYSGLVSYSRSINAKLSIGLDASLERITATSGHNSKVEYSLEEEHGGSVNEVMLTMASPLGFIESNVIVERTTSGGGAPTQDIVLDLHNTHRMTNVSIAPMVNYTVLTNENITFVISGGLGANYISGIKNQLTSFDVDNPDFKSGSSNITEDQTGLQKITPFSSLGLSVRKNLMNNNFIGLKVKLNNNISPIYKQDDFSTSIVRTQFNLFFGRSF